MMDTGSRQEEAPIGATTGGCRFEDPARGARSLRLAWTRSETAKDDPSCLGKVDRIIDPNKCEI
jgi:hypothetical protein